MALPKIQQPLFELTIPSTKKKVQFRPFTVKEEKILLIAQESKDIEQIVLSMKQIVNNCVKDIDVEKLSTFDMEYILLNIRSKSVGEIIPFTIRDPETDEEIQLQLNLNELELKEFDGHTNKIAVSDGVVVVMKYPKIDQMLLLNNITAENKNDVMFDMMINCIDSVVEGEEVHKIKDFTKDEIVEFVDGLTGSSIRDIKKFFDTMPVLGCDLPYTTSNGKKKVFSIRGTESFFM